MKIYKNKYVTLVEFIPLGTPKISLRYRSALLLQSVVYRRMFTKCLAGFRPAGHFHFQQLFSCDPYTALAESVHHDAPISVQSGAADIDVRRGGTAMPHERLGHGQPAGSECYGCGLVAQGVEAEGLDPCLAAQARHQFAALLEGLSKRPVAMLLHEDVIHHAGADGLPPAQGLGQFRVHGHPA